MLHDVDFPAESVGKSTCIFAIAQCSIVKISAGKSTSKKKILRRGATLCGFSGSKFTAQQQQIFLSLPFVDFQSDFLAVFLSEKLLRGAPTLLIAFRVFDLLLSLSV